MWQWIGISLLALTAGHAQADKQLLTCDNYRVVLQSSVAFDYPSGQMELDCQPQPPDDLLYKSSRKQVPPHQRPNLQAQTFTYLMPYQNKEDMLDRNLITMTDAELIERYLINPHFVSIHLSQAELERLASDFIVRHLLNIPDTPLATLLAMADGKNCRYLETTYDVNTYIRYNEAIEHTNGLVRAWFLGSCQGQGATLFIQQPTVENGGVRTYSIGPISNDFTRFHPATPPWTEINFFMVDMSTDGQTLLMAIPSIDFPNASHKHLYGTEQLNIWVYTPNQVLALPTQKFIQHEHGINAKLSNDGNSVVVATAYHIKWYDYQAELAQFKLVGQYQHLEPAPLALDTLALTTNDHQVYIQTLQQQPGAAYLINFN